MPEQTPPSGIDLARVAFAAARAAAKERPSGPAKKKRGAGRPSRRGSGRDPVSAMEAVKQMLVDRGYEVPAAGGTVVGQWASMAPDFAERTAAEAFDADTGTLSVRPASSAYGAQLRLNERAIIARINDRMGRPLVTALRILPPSPGARTAVAAGPSPAAPAVSRPPRQAPDGYRQAKAVLQAAPRPEADPLAASVRRATQAQVDALLRNREPQERFADGVAFQEDLATQQRRTEDSRQRARAFARAEKSGRTPVVPQAVDRTA